MIICVLSIANVHWLFTARLTKEEKKVSWNVCFDEVGQTRGMTASPEILSSTAMANLDTGLQNLVLRSKACLCMEYRLLQDDVDWAMGLARMTTVDATASGKLVAVRTSEDKMFAEPSGAGGGVENWHGKHKVRYTTNEGVAFAWLRQCVIESLDLKSLRIVVPILVPCNYSKMAEAIVLWLRQQVGALCRSQGVSAPDIEGLQKRIRLIHQDMT